MRYFFLISCFFLIIFTNCTSFIPTYNLSLEESTPIASNSGVYSVSVQSPKNIWYIGFSHSDMISDSLCVEWSFDHQKKTECIDHDGDASERKFVFPALSDAMTTVTFRIIGQEAKIFDPTSVIVYSLDTRASGSRIAFQLPGAKADNGIVSRKDWGADESLRYADSPEWKTKYSAYMQYVRNPKTAEQIRALKIEDDRMTFIKNNFGSNAVTTSLIRTENGHPLVWPIQNVQQVSRIVLHHTAESMDSGKSDEEMIRGIYRYHTLSREWGDIGYNYLVGQRGTIYEGRAGGDYVVASHAAYNNMGTVGISILGDYNKNHLNGDQIAGIKKVVNMMAAKYGITLADTKNGLIKCDTALCYPFQMITTASLLGHQDIGHTDCPGTSVYTYIPEFIASLSQPYIPVMNPIVGTIAPLPADQMMNMMLRVESVNLPSIAPPILAITTPVIRYTGPKFRVKLSYPDQKSVVLATADGKMAKVMLDKQRIHMQVSQKLSIEIVDNNTLRVRVGEQYYTGSVLRFAHSVVRVDSWDRVPDWDKSGKYNDNLFRDTIRVLSQDGKLTLVNDLPVEWYLKGLGEVSNGDLAEKIKVIIVAARSYAKFYMDPKNRKFATNLYDGSDNPDEFQKYLGYGYEGRSPNVARMVDATRGQVITYSGSIIKAWYHSSSDGRTLSALEYCEQNGSKKCLDIPYLQSVSDPGSVGRTRSGHGVGISGVGATYWANSGWDYKKIIQYYLSGVEIQKK